MNVLVKITKNCYEEHRIEWGVREYLKESFGQTEFLEAFCEQVTFALEEK